MPCSLDFQKPPHVVSHASRCRIGLLGFGTVGSAVARRLAVGATPGLELTHIFDRRAASKRKPLGRGAGLSSAAPEPVWTDRIEEILTSEVDIVVEAVGGLDPAAEWIRAALMAGKSVVTANKQVIARHGPALATLAARQGRQLRFEGAVGGAMPIVRAIGDGLAGDRLVRLVSILNGTTNAVLSRMEATGCLLEEAVSEARACGYAEADPSADLDGLDAAAKLSILCALAFGLRVDPSQIATRTAAGIRPAEFNQAARQGCTIRQLAFAEYEVRASLLTAWVAPTVVSQSSLFARAVGPQNVAIITGEHAGEVGLFGAGAGGDPTSVAVLGDLAAIARDRAAIVPAPVLSVPRVIRGLEATRETLFERDSHYLFAEAV